MTKTLSGSLLITHNTFLLSSEIFFFFREMFLETLSLGEEEHKKEPKPNLPADKKSDQINIKIP